MFHVSRNPPSSAAGMLLQINVNFLTHKVDKVYRHPAFLNMLCASKQDYTAQNVKC
jgi:hypothetical protein